MPNSHARIPSFEARELVFGIALTIATGVLPDLLGSKYWAHNFQLVNIVVAAHNFYLEQAAERRDGATYNRQTGARISALVVMHVFGHPCDMDTLAALAVRWHLILIEDAA